METLEDRRLLTIVPLADVAASLQGHISGATIITHGFQLLNGDGDSLMPLAQAIQTKADAANGPSASAWLLDYEIPAEGQLAGFDSVQTTLPTIGSGSGEVVLLFDWAPESNEASFGWTEAAGDAVFNTLVGLGIVNPALGAANTIPLHFIGHSFGAAVTSEAVERLATYHVPVDQLTYLDPHDFSELPLIVDTAQRQSEVGRPVGYGASVWDNVTFADVYYETRGLGGAVNFVVPEGRPIPGAYNVLLDTELPAASPNPYSLSDAAGDHGYAWSGFYQATVTGTLPAGQPAASQAVDYSRTGYAFSRVAGGQALRANVNALPDFYGHQAGVGTVSTLVTGLSMPRSLAVGSASNGRIYWSDGTADAIKSTLADGTDLQTVVGGLSDPDGIALDEVGGKIYWVDETTKRIQRANLNGSTVENLVTTGVSVPRKIALDAGVGKMYWTDAGTGKIVRANLNGSGASDFLTGLNDPDGIALDPVARKIYWSERGSHSIRVANLDGSPAPQTLVGGLGSPRGISVDPAGGKLYWADFNTKEIRRSNLNGSSVEILITSTTASPYSVAYSAISGKLAWSTFEGAGNSAVRGVPIYSANLQDHSHSDPTLVNTSTGQPNAISLAEIGLTDVQITTARWSSQWSAAEIVNGNFHAPGDTILGLPPTRNIIPGWSHHGGSGSGTIVVDPSGCDYYLVLEGSQNTSVQQQRTHNALYVDSQAKFLTVDIKRTLVNSGGELRVFLGANQIGTVSLNQSDSGFISQAFAIPAAARNKSLTLKFEIVGANGAAVAIDNVRFFDGKASSVANELSRELEDVEGKVLGQIGAALNLPFSLPIASRLIADAIGVGAVLRNNFNLPALAGVTSMAGLGAALSTAGFSVTQALNDAQLATLNPAVTTDIARFNRTFHLGNLQANGALDDQLLEALDDLLGLNLSGAASLIGSLDLNLSFGIDTRGFFIAPGQILTAGIDVSANALAGIANFGQLTGTGQVHVTPTVNLLPNSGSDKYRICDLDDVAASLRATATGSAQFDASFVLGPIVNDWSLTFGGHWGWTIDGNQALPVTLAAGVSGFDGDSLLRSLATYVGSGLSDLVANSGQAAQSDAALLAGVLGRVPFVGDTLASLVSDRLATGLSLSPSSGSVFTYLASHGVAGITLLGQPVTNGQILPQTIRNLFRSGSLPQDLISLNYAWQSGNVSVSAQGHGGIDFTDQIALKMSGSVSGSVGADLNFNLGIDTLGGVYVKEGAHVGVLANAAGALTGTARIGSLADITASGSASLNATAAITIDDGDSNHQERLYLLSSQSHDRVSIRSVMDNPQFISLAGSLTLDSLSLSASSSALKAIPLIGDSLNTVLGNLSWQASANYNLATGVATYTAQAPDLSQSLQNQLVDAIVHKLAGNFADHNPIPSGFTELLNTDLAFLKGWSLADLLGMSNYAILLNPGSIDDDEDVAGADGLSLQIDIAHSLTQLITGQAVDWVELSLKKTFSVDAEPIPVVPPMVVATYFGVVDANLTIEVQPEMSLAANLVIGLDSQGFYLRENDHVISLTGSVIAAIHLTGNVLEVQDFAEITGTAGIALTGSLGLTDGNAQTTSSKLRVGNLGGSNLTVGLDVGMHLDLSAKVGAPPIIPWREIGSVSKDYSLYHFQSGGGAEPGSTDFEGLKNKIIEQADKATYVLKAGLLFGPGGYAIAAAYAYRQEIGAAAERGAQWADEKGREASAYIGNRLDVAQQSLDQGIQAAKQFGANFDRDVLQPLAKISGISDFVNYVSGVGGHKNVDVSGKFTFDVTAGSDLVIQAHFDQPARLTIDVIDGDLVIDGPDFVTDEIVSKHYKNGRRVYDDPVPYTHANLYRIPLAQVSHLTIIGTGFDDNILLRPSVAIAARIEGGAGNDFLVGGSGNDELIGGSGNDRLVGNQGADRLEGGDNEDTLVGGWGWDTLLGQGGDDLLDEETSKNLDIYGSVAVEGSRSQERNTLSGGSGKDTLIGSPGDDQLEGDSDGSLADDRDILRGNAGNDNLTGGGFDDDLDGGGGNDTLHGSSGDDILVGGVGTDYVYGDEGDDQLFGDEQLIVDDNTTTPLDSDWLYGGAGSDGMHGGRGDDHLFGQAGADLLFGDAGNDELEGGTDSDPADGNDFISGGSGNDTLRGGASGALRPILPGSSTSSVSFNQPFDILQGDKGDDWLYGQSGDDLLVGGEDNDWLYGGSENDTLRGTSGSDHIFGESGDDLIVGSTIAVIGSSLDGGVGADVIFGTPADDMVYGGDDNDSLFGSTGNDRVWGGSGNDLISAGSGSDLVYGEAGNDWLSGESGSDFIDGGAGADHLYGDSTLDTDFSVIAATIAAGNDTISGGADNDFLYGEVGDDRLAGGAGADFVDAGAGSDIVYGDSTLNETAVRALPSAGTEGSDTVSAGSEQDSVYGEAGDDWLAGGAGADFIDAGAGVDHVYGDSTLNESAVRSLPVAGTEGNDTISGSTEADFLYGEAGNDRLAGGAGADFVDAGAGSDIVYGDSILNETTLRTLPIAGTEGADTVSAGSEQDSIYGEAGDDWLAGGAGADYIDAGAGVDHAYGDSTLNELAVRSLPVAGTDGNDTISGSTEADFLYGEAGNDRLAGGAGADFIDAGAGSDFVYGDSTLNETGVRTLPIAGTEGLDRLSGGSENDTVFGEAGNDSLAGGAGSDYVDGSTGDNILYGDSTFDATGALILPTPGTEGGDVLSGGTGFDSLFGEGGDDNLGAGLGDDFIDAGPGADTVYGDSTVAFVVSTVHWSTPAGGSGGRDTLQGGSGADTLYGEAGQDSLSGGSQNDTVWGGPDDDRLEGNDGIDTLYGGYGRDTLLLDVDPSYLVNGLETLDGDFGNLTSGDLGVGADSIDTLLIIGTATGDAIEIFQTTQNVLDGAVSINYSGIAVPLQVKWKSAGNPTIEQFKIVGQDGSDMISVRAGTDLSGLEDTGSAAVWIEGGGGNDTLKGSNYHDEIIGGLGNDKLYGYAGDDTLWGDDQSTSSGSGQDTLFAGNGGDDLFGGGGNDLLYAWSDEVALALSTETTGYNRMHGGPGVDELHGGTGLDFLYGGDPTDNDRLYDRNDKLFDFGTGAAVSLDPVNGSWKQPAIQSGRVWYIGGTEANDDLTVKYATFDFTSTLHLTTHYLERKTPGKVDVSFGMDFANWATKGIPVDSVGLPTWNANDDDDFDAILVDGLAGDDRITIGESVKKPVWVDAGLGNDYVRFEQHTSGLGNDLRNVIIGGPDNLLSDQSDNDVLLGSASSDWIFGGAGNDWITSGLDGTRRDIIVGGAGNDTFQLVPDSDASVLTGNSTDLLEGGAGDDVALMLGLDTNGSIGLKDFIAVRYAGDRYELTTLVLDQTTQKFIRQSDSGPFPERSYAFRPLDVEHFRVDTRGGDDVVHADPHYVLNNRTWGLNATDGPSGTLTPRLELLGGNDNDRLYGGFGDDLLRGGAGNDELVGGRTSTSLDLPSQFVPADQVITSMYDYELPASASVKPSYSDPGLENVVAGVALTDPLPITPTSLTNATAIVGASLNEQLSHSEVVPDVNGDGIDDLLLWSEQKVYLLLGPIEFNSQVGVGANGELAERVGLISSVGRPASRMGDVNHDGLGDLVFIGSNSVTGMPEIRVDFGSKTLYQSRQFGSNQPAIITLPGSFASPANNISAETADWDGDRFDDLLVTVTTNGNRVETYVFSGQSLVAQPFQSVNNAISSFTSEAQSTQPTLAGDTDGDGREDLIGSPRVLGNVAIVTRDQANSASAILSDGGSVSVWLKGGNSTELVGQVLEPDGTPRGDEFSITGPEGIGGRISVAATPGGGFIAAWDNDIAGAVPDGSEAIFARKFDRCGKATSEVLQVSEGEAYQIAPHVAVDGTGNFLVVWDGRGNAGGVRGRLFNFDGTHRPNSLNSQGGSFAVTTGPDRASSDVAMDANGNFVVVWRGINQDYTSYEIYGRRFDANVVLTHEFVVNSDRPGLQEGPRLAMEANGKFVVTWISDHDLDNQSPGICAQRFDAECNALGSMIHVNTNTAGVQDGQVIGIGNHGEFVVAWNSYNEGSDPDSGIQAQLFSADGEKIGSQFHVNLATANNQYTNSVNFTPQGDFVVTWGSYDQGLSSPSVYAQRYQASAGVGTTYRLGDLNCDGYDDIGVLKSGTGGQQALLSILLGSERPDAEPDIVVQANVTGGFLLNESAIMAGLSIASGDLNSDGQEDLIIGQPEVPAGASGSELGGRVFVLWSIADRGAIRTLSSADIALESGLTGGRLGLIDSSELQDVNDDGIVDLLVGDSSSSANAGKIYLIYGSRQTYPADLQRAVDAVNADSGGRDISFDDHEHSAVTGVLTPSQAESWYRIDLTEAGHARQQIRLNAAAVSRTTEVTASSGRFGKDGTGNYSATPDNSMIGGFDQGELMLEFDLSAFLGQVEHPDEIAKAVLRLPYQSADMSLNDRVQIFTLQDEGDWKVDANDAKAANTGPQPWVTISVTGTVGQLGGPAGVDLSDAIRSTLAAGKTRLTLRISTTRGQLTIPALYLNENSPQLQVETRVAGVLADLYDARGAKLQTSTPVVDLANLDAGIFFLRVFNPDQAGQSSPLTYSLQFNQVVLAEPRITDRDEIHGGSGDDTIYGGPGLDHIFGEESGVGGDHFKSAEPIEIRDFGSEELDDLLGPLTEDLSSVVIPQRDQIVEIPDSGLRAAVADALGIARTTSWDGQTLLARDLRQSDLIKLVALDAGHRGIRSLSGLEAARNLTALNLADNHLEHATTNPLSPLSNLWSGLQYVTLDKNMLASSDITSTLLVDVGSTLAYPNLRALSLDDNNLEGSLSLSAVPNLRFFSSDGPTDHKSNQPGIDAISSLVHLPQTLKWLSVSEQNIADLTSIASLDNLEYLQLQNNMFGNITPLVGTRLVDDGDNGFSTPVGTWLRNVRNLAPDRVLDGDYRYVAPTRGTIPTAVARWDFVDLEPGEEYEIWATWHADDSHATNAQYRLSDPDVSTSPQTYLARQNLAPGFMAAGQSPPLIGRPWENIGKLTSSHGNLRVELSNVADGLVIADGIRLVRVRATLPVLKELRIEGNPLDNHASSSFAPQLNTRMGLSFTFTANPTAPQWLQELEPHYDSDSGATSFFLPNLAQLIAATDPDGDPVHFTAYSDDPTVIAIVSGDTLTVTFPANAPEATRITVVAHDRPATDYGRTAEQSFVLHSSTNLATAPTYTVYGTRITSGGTSNAEGRLVFADLNANGIADPGEPSTITDVGGQYSLPILQSMIPTVVMEQRFAEWEQPFPGYTLPKSAWTVATTQPLSVPLSSLSGNKNLTATRVVNLGIDRRITEGSRLDFVQSDVIVDANPADGSVFRLDWTVRNDSLNTEVATGTGPAYGYTFPDDGNYSVYLVVTDESGGGNLYGDRLRVQVENLPPKNVSAGGTYSRYEGSSLTLNGVATDPAGPSDPLNFAWDVNGDGNFTDAVGPNPTLSWSQLVALGINDGPTSRQVKVRVIDGDGGTTDSPSVTLSILNLPPLAVTAGGPYVINEGISLSLLASASDPAGALDPLTYAWDLNGDGVFTDAVGKNPTVSWPQLVSLGINDGPATRQIKVRVTDDDGGSRDSTAVTLTVSNVPPQDVSAGGPYTINEGSSITLLGHATDPAGGFDPLTYDWDLNGDGNFGDATGISPTLSWSQIVSLGIGASASAWQVRVRVSDNDNGTVVSAISPLTIQNLAPVDVSAGQPYSIQEGGNLTLYGSATDFGSAPLSFYWDINGDGVFGDATGSIPVVSWDQLKTLGITDAPATSVTFNVRVRVDDHHGGIVDSPSVPLTLSNAPPQVSAGGPYFVIEGNGFTLFATATDPGLDPLTYSWDINGDGVYGDKSGNNPVVSSTELANWGLDDGPWTTSVSVQVSDDDGGVTYATAPLSLLNRAPDMVSAGGPYYVAEGQTLALSATASDVAGTNDPLQFTWDVDGDGQFDDGVGPLLSLNWSQLAALGLNDGPSTVSQVRVRADDGDGALTLSAFSTIHILNSPPTALAGGPYTITEGNPLTLHGLATDPARAFDAITYAWDLNSDDIYTDAFGSDPTVNWTALIALGLTSGPFIGNVRLRATDSDGAQATSAGAALTILNAPPTGADAGGPYTISEGSGLSLNAVAADPSGADALTFSWDINGDGVFGDAVGKTPNLTWTQLNLLGVIDGPTTRTVRVQVDDGDGGIVISGPVLLTLTNSSPSASAGGPYVIIEGGSLTLKADAFDPAGLSDPLSYTWDINGDGTFGDASGPSPMLTWSQLALLGISNGPASRQVSVRVTDGDGAVATSASATVTVLNAPPAAVSAGGPYVISAGSSVTLSASATDPAGTADPLSFAWDLNGDGNYGDASGAMVVLSWMQLQNLDYQTGQIRTIRVQVSDGSDFAIGSSALTIRSASRPGDANGDGLVDGADYIVWADNFLKSNRLGPTQGDFNSDGLVDGADYTVWADHFLSPAPATVPQGATVEAAPSPEEAAGSPAINGKTFRTGRDNNALIERNVGIFSADSTPVRPVPRVLSVPIAGLGPHELSRERTLDSVFSDLSLLEEAEHLLTSDPLVPCNLAVDALFQQIDKTDALERRFTTKQRIYRRTTK